MAKQRVVDTNFWSDNYIVDLDPLEKLLYLYFLTNEHTNICGIYELPLKTMAYETGLDKELLPKMIGRFEGKIHYIDGWICIKNFIKHQSTSSKTVQTGIKDNLQKVPFEVIEELIGYGYPLDRVSGHIIYLNTNTNTNISDKQIVAVRELVNYFFILKGWEDKEPKFYRENNISYGRFCKEAKQLLELCDNDLGAAKSKLDVLKRKMTGLDGWVIGTAIKKFYEI